MRIADRLDNADLQTFAASTPFEVTALVPERSPAE
jgi:hypothetical protein